MAMTKIKFVNGSQPAINDTNLNKLQDNIDNAKVNKSGDTMTGSLNIANKGVFEGMKKIRTIDGEDYIAIFGVGSDGSACIEINCTNVAGTLGRINIMPDGKIQNFKTQKYLVEQNTWKTAKTNSSYCTGTCKYLEIGNALIITIQDLAITSNVVHNNALFSGLPSGKEQLFLVNQFNTTTHKRLKLDNSGNIVDWYDPIATSASQFYGNVIC